jgi:NADH:ubiquinone reductase (H+-translocating)
MRQLPKVVIVGAGFGGLSAAKSLAHDSVEVVVIDRQNHHLFQPLLYQVATAALSPADIAAPIRSVLRAGVNPRLKVLMDEVTGVDTTARVVHTRDGAEQDYDYLILATGSSYFYFAHPEWAAIAPALKTVDDAIEIRRRVLTAFERAETTKDEQARQRLLTFLIVGGGPTGVEMAGALAELARATLAADFDNIDTRKTRILLVEAGRGVLGAFPEQLGEYATKALRRLGVELWTDARLTNVTAEGAWVEGVFVPAGNIIWCAGVRATPGGAWLNAATSPSGAIIVGDDLSVPGHPNIFAIGDLAAYSPSGGRPLPGLAPVAKQMGKHVAAVISARVSGSRLPSSFRYRDWGSMATIGRSAAVGQFGRLQTKGHIAWLLWSLVHVTYLVGFRNRIVVVVNWLWAWLTYAKGARLITNEQPAPSTAPLAGGIRAVDADTLPSGVVSAATTPQTDSAGRHLH